jgi:hypothetical protein
MAEFNVGDKVRIKNKADWPTKPGFVFKNAEGMVIHSDFDELMEEFQSNMVFVQLDKTEENAKQYKDIGLWFLTDDLEKM